MYRNKSKLALQSIAVWKRNFTEWSLSPIIGVSLPLVEPIIFLLFFGYGISLIYEIPNRSEYLFFLSTGFIAAWPVNVTIHEATYGVYTRIAERRIYEQILLTPMSVNTILIGEVLWSMTRAIIVGLGILITIYIFQISDDLTLLPVTIIVSLISSMSIIGISLIICRYASNYQYFTYYFTLFTLPMMLFSGVYFPVTELPKEVQYIIYILPLYHCVEVSRYLAYKIYDLHLILHITVILIYFIASLLIAFKLFKTRLLS